MFQEKGFILTSKYYDIKNKLHLEFLGTNDNGAFKLIFNTEKIVFFIEAELDLKKSNIQFTEKAVHLKAFNKKPVKAIYTDSLVNFNLLKNFVRDNNIKTFELDVLPTERFLMERFIQGSIEFQGRSFEEVNGIRVFHNPQVKRADYTPNFSVLSLDIETGIDHSIYSIGMAYYSSQKNQEIVLMRAEENTRMSETVYYLKSEKDLLEGFLKYIHFFDPDLIIGWHVIGFDLNFLYNKCLQHNLKLSIGRGNSNIILEENPATGLTANLPGRLIIDGPPVLRSAFYKYKDFKLETVATAVLGTGKDISSDQGKVEEIENRFKNDKMALAKYNILDCKLVHEIYSKLNIYSFIINRIKNTGLLYDRVNMSTTAFDFLYLPRLHRKGFVAPNRFDLSRETEGSGGLVLEPDVGAHSTVGIFDFKSLYPSIIRTFGIDPLALTTNDEHSIKTPSHHSFNKENAILPELIADLMHKRAQAKLNGQSAQQQTIKILMNSFYGIMGSTKSRFYHHDLSSAITETGQWILNQTKNYFEQRGYKVLYGDTDSLFIKLRSINDIPDLLDNFNKTLSERLKNEFQVNSFLELEHEMTFDQIFFPPGRGQNEGAKKRYVGISNKNLVFKGMESVRSDWTEVSKIFQRKLFEYFFNGEDIESYIKEFIKELENGIYDEYLIYSKRLSKDPKEYDKNIPPHVKAALLLNHQGPYRLKKIEYVYTKNGPYPVQLNPGQYDYQHYIQKQLRPIAEDILKTKGQSFDSLMDGDQLTFL